MFIPNIGQAMTLVGSTINPVIGFIIPVLFYQKLLKNKPWYHIDRLFSYFVILFVIVVSILSLYEFFTSNNLQSENPETCWMLKNYFPYII